MSGMEEWLLCAREECEEKFILGRAANQKYCSAECCRIATNKAIMEKYYDRRARLKGKTRICKQCQTTKLSRYNTNTICASCEQKNDTARTLSAWEAINILLN